jgi:hypothetical protein
MKKKGSHVILSEAKDRSAGRAILRSLRSLRMTMLIVPASLAAQTPSYSVRAENPLAITRADETIALRWSDVHGRLASATPA